MGSEWIESDPPMPTPAVVILSATVSGPGAETALVDLEAGEITTPAGTTIQASGEIQIGGVKFAPFSGHFRMPVQASDGREKVVLATITAGNLAAAFPCKEVGIWSVTEDAINRDLSEEQKLQFRGLRVYVLDV
jgi:hypothetical protein